MTPNLHPTAARLALYAGKDLGWWGQWSVQRHVANCSGCQADVDALQNSNAQLCNLAPDLPADVNWTRLSQEMTGNIRVGLAAGECIADFEKSVRPSRPRIAWLSGTVLGCAAIVVVASLWLNLPTRQMDHLISAVGQVRWGRIGSSFRTPATNQDAVVLEANPLAIEVKMNGHGLALMHPSSAGATVSVNMQDSAGVRYVDADSGQVTLNKVYYAQ